MNELWFKRNSMGAGTVNHTKRGTQNLDPGDMGLRADAGSYWLRTAIIPALTLCRPRYLSAASFYFLVALTLSLERFLRQSARCFATLPNWSG